LLYFVLFITSFSSQNQQMCAEFWIQNKDIIGFSTKAVTIVRKRYLSHYFFNLLLLFNAPYLKAIKLKLTCYCIKNIIFFLMNLMKSLNQQLLQTCFYNNISFSLNDSIDDVFFNINLSIIEKNLMLTTLLLIFLRNLLKISSSFNKCSFSFLNHDYTEEDE